MTHANRRPGLPNPAPFVDPVRVTNGFVKRETDLARHKTLTRDDCLHAARAYLAASKHWGRCPFAHSLLTWAAGARRRAANLAPPPRIPTQMPLFT